MGAPAPGDYTRDLQLSGSSGKTTVVPVVLRSLVPLGRRGGSFSGTITGGNGNGWIGREDTLRVRCAPWRSGGQRLAAAAE